MVSYFSHLQAGFSNSRNCAKNWVKSGPQQLLALFYFASIEKDHLNDSESEFNKFCQNDFFVFLTYKTALANSTNARKIPKSYGCNDLSDFAIFLLFSLSVEGFRIQPIPEKHENSSVSPTSLFFLTSSSLS